MLSHLWAQIDPFQLRAAFQFFHSSNAFCAICRTCSCSPSDSDIQTIQTGGNPENQNDQVKFDRDDTMWLEDLQIIGGHPKAGQNAMKHCVDSVFTTGTIKRAHGKVSFHGNPLNFPGLPMQYQTDEDDPYLTVDEDDLHLYTRPSTASDASLYLMVHSICHDILRRVMKLDSSIPIAPSVFDKLRLHFFFPERTICKWVGDIPRGLRLTDSMLPFINPSSQKLSSAINSSSHSNRVVSFQTPIAALAANDDSPSGDQFFTLPLELMMMIAEYLSPKDIMALSFASASAKYYMNNIDIWSRKIQSQMPWLWDFDADQIVLNMQMRSNPAYIDWSRIYLDLMSSCKSGPMAVNYGIKNRKRIWRLCEKIQEQKGGNV